MEKIDPFYNTQTLLLEKIRRELLALREDAKANKIPITTSDFTGISIRINEILKLYASN